MYRWECTNILCVLLHYTINHNMNKNGFTCSVDSSRIEVVFGAGREPFPCRSCLRNSSLIYAFVASNMAITCLLREANDEYDTISDIWSHYFFGFSEVVVFPKTQMCNSIKAPWLDSKSPHQHLMCLCGHCMENEGKSE